MNKKIISSGRVRAFQKTGYCLHVLMFLHIIHIKLTYFSKLDPRWTLRKLSLRTLVLPKWLKTKTWEYWQWIASTVRRCMKQHLTCVVPWSTCVLIWVSLSLVLFRILSFSVNSNFSLSSSSSVSLCLLIWDLFSVSWACNCCSRSLIMEFNSGVKKTVKIKDTFCLEGSYSKYLK